MDSENKKNVNQTAQIKNEFKSEIKQLIPDKFDISIIGKIDLLEAEKIASEEVIFLNESDLIDGLEDFELVPVKIVKDTTSIIKEEIYEKKESGTEDEIAVEKVINETFNNKTVESIAHNQEHDTNQEFEASVISNQIFASEVEHITAEHLKDNHEFNNSLNEVTNNSTLEKIENISEDKLIINDIVEIPETSEKLNVNELTSDITETKKYFTVKINEETLDAQLFSILKIENSYKSEDKNLEKINETDLKYKFVDDQYFFKKIADDNVSYNEDPLTERLVKMIEVADGKLELLEITSKEGVYNDYILEDYTLYNSEKFDTIFKEEVFYLDTDFEFIDNAIIRDDFTKYIHEIDDYFESEDSLIQSEISEILGLIPEENEYIDDKLFSEYYKKYDLDNEIDFIKPEIDFFRINYTGTKNLNYFTENEYGVSDSEKKSIEEDISSPNAIVFEENITEIEEILKQDYNFDLNDIRDNEPVVEVIITRADEIQEPEELPDITDKIIILEDKEKLLDLVSEFPEKHENLIRLLSYLDGLFEKLPEEVIRKFAESEYFELYSKVLKEIGV